MPSPRKRRQKKLLLREQEREEVIEVLPIEEAKPKKTIAKKVAEVLSLDDEDEEEE